VNIARIAGNQNEKFRFFAEGRGRNLRAGQIVAGGTK